MGYPKALANIHGTPLLTRHLTQHQGYFDGAIVVLGCHFDEITAKCQLSQWTVVQNTRWQDGQARSVQVGLRAVPPQTGVLLSPVDCPPIHYDSYRAFFRAIEKNPNAWALIPTAGGQPGHPIYLAPPAIAAYLHPETPPPMHHFLASIDDKCQRVEVADPRIHLNINTPEELADYHRRYPAQKG